MPRPRLLVWFAVWLILALATAGFWFLLQQQGAVTLAVVVSLVGSLLTGVWTVAGLVWWNARCLG